MASVLAQDRSSALKELLMSVKDYRESVNIPLAFGDHLETRRWWILLAYFLYSYFLLFISKVRTTSACAYLSYAPVPDASAEYFDIQQEEVFEFSNAPLYAFFLLSYIVNSAKLQSLICIGCVFHLQEVCNHILPRHLWQRCWRMVPLLCWGQFQSLYDRTVYCRSCGCTCRCYGSS